MHPRTSISECVQLWLVCIFINSVWRAENFHIHTKASLRSVNLSRVSIKSYLDPSIHSQSGFHPARMTPGLSLYISLPAMWQNCGQMVGQVCPLIQNDKFSLDLLPRDSSLPDLTGRASNISGRQRTEPELAPRSGAVFIVYSETVWVKMVFCIYHLRLCAATDENRRSADNRT